LKKNKWMASAMAAVIGFSTFTLSFAPAQEAQAEASTEKAPAVTYSPKASQGGAPFDSAIANEDKLIEMLKEEGKISQDATEAEAQEALNAYLKQREEQSAEAAKQPLPKELEEAAIDENVVSDTDKPNGNADNAASASQKQEALKKGKDKGKDKKKDRKVDNVKEEKYEGEVREDKVLVLAIDFPDYKNSSITPEETDMWYEDYTHDHFQNMIFGEDGYTGPDGQDFTSMKQYYEAQSGGSYTVDGEIAGWYTADHPAAYYGANDPAPDGSDAAARELVYEALTKAGQDPDIDLSEYDQWDRDDYDGDGVYHEPDGIIDHLMVIHAGVGEEAGGGSLGGDAIWSHRWNLGGLVAVPGGSSASDRFDGQLAAYDYTIEPEDGAMGVFAHEYGHDLGLPDEYDTNYTGQGEAVAYWSIMASGSWAGDVPGTEPSGFSAYAKEYLQNAHGGNWLSGTTIDAEDLDGDKVELLLDEAVTKGTNNDVIRVNLPDKETEVTKPASGTYAYFGGKGNNVDNSMTATVDLTNASSAELTFKTWYDIEQDWDYASVKVNGETVPGSITTTENPNDQNPGDGITGTSEGWVDATFDLSAYAGQEIELSLNYWTDVAVNNAGFYVDDIQVTADGSSVLTDDAEADSSFELAGFAQDKGVSLSEHYYLLEWRTHNGVDIGLDHIRRGDSLMSYNTGLLVWYVDNSYDDNWTGTHPGEGFLGVVDADQKGLYWSDESVASTRYQIHDAAFSKDKSEKMFLDYRATNGLTLKDNHTKSYDKFKDDKTYLNKALPDAGRNVPEYGLEFEVKEDSPDGTVGKIEISR